MSQAFGMTASVVEQKGKKLQSNAASLASEYNKLVKYNDDLKKAWNGQDADKYFNMWEDKKNSINKLKNWLSDYADATVNSAVQTRKTAEDVSSAIR